MELTSLLDALYRNVTATSGVWLVIWSASGQILYISDALAQLAGASSGPWLHRPIQDLIAPPAMGISAVVWAHDALPPATIRCEPLSLLNQSLTLATFKPLTLTALDWIDHISDAAFALDLELRVLRFNAPAAHLYGDALSIGGTIHQLVPMRYPDDTTLDELWLLLAQRGLWQGELLHRSGASGLLHLHTTFSLIASPSGEPEGVLVLCNPAAQETRSADRRAERQRLEQHLVHFSRIIGVAAGGEEVYLPALESLRDGLRVWRASLVVTPPDAQPSLLVECARGAAPALLKRPLPAHDALREVLTSADWFAGPPRALPPEPAVWLAAEGVRSVALLPLVHQSTLLGYLRLDDDDDERLWHPDDLRLLRFAAEQLVSALVRADAAQRQRTLEERMLQTQKMESLGLLAGGVAHDFKNLLIGIIANAQFVRDALRPDPRNASLTDALDDVLLAGRRAGDLVHQMLTYAGRSSTPDEQVALAALAEEAVVLLRASLHPRVSLTRELPPTLPPIRGDSSQLSQLILNLLINASEALGDQGGQLWLRAGECELDAAQLLLAAAGHEAPLPGPYAYVEVEDRGVGISPEQLPRIFDPFYTSKVNGRGLGLAVVLGAVRAHRGVLFVESEVGRGTRIRAAIPALPAALTPTLEVTSDVFDALPAAPRRRYVVVVDDEPVVRSLTQRIFERYQIPAIICESGPEFLDLLDRRPDEIALVLLDFSMPGMSGLDVLAVLRTRHPDLPVFLSSGFEQHLMTGIEDDPHTSFISKPYTPVGLMRQLQPALEQTTD